MEKNQAAKENAKVQFLKHWFDNDFLALDKNNNVVAAGIYMEKVRCKAYSLGVSNPIVVRAWCVRTPWRR